jgi:hypothetical protein
MAGARRTDPATSHEAAARVENITESQRCVYLMLLTAALNDTDGFALYRKTAAVVASIPMMSESGYRSRRAELVAKGLVRDTGERVKLASGRNSIVWASIPEKKKWWAIR